MYTTLKLSIIIIVMTISACTTSPPLPPTRGNYSSGLQAPRRPLNEPQVENLGAICDKTINDVYEVLKEELTPCTEAWNTGGVEGKFDCAIDFILLHPGTTFPKLIRTSHRALRVADGISTTDSLLEEFSGCATYYFPDEAAIIADYKAKLSDILDW